MLGRVLRFYALLSGARVFRIDDAVGVSVRATVGGRVIWRRDTSGSDAAIVGIGDAIAVVVRIRATIVILETVAIFGSGRARIGRAFHAVLVRIGIGATPFDRIGARDTGHVRAVVIDVEDLVEIVVGFGATILVVEAVQIFCLVFALVECVFDPVFIVVDVGAAVLVLEAVVVLGKLRALVGFIEDAVVIEIVFARRPTERERPTHRRVANARDRGDVDAGEERQIIVEGVTRASPKLHLAQRSRAAREGAMRIHRHVTVRLGEPLPVALFVETEGLRLDGEREVERDFVAKARRAILQRRVACERRAAKVVTFAAEFSAERPVKGDCKQVVAREQARLARDVTFTEVGLLVACRNGHALHKR